MEIQSTSQGLQRTLQQFQASVQRQQSPQGDMIREAITQRNLLRDTQAQVSSIRAQDEMLGTLFDAFA